MNINTARQLIDITTQFYAQTAASFSASRHNSWPGWNRFLEELDAKAPAGKALSIADLASGNLRFEAYVERILPERSFSFYTADNCDVFTLEQVKSTLNHRKVDLLDQLLRGTLALKLDVSPCDAAVCFGFLHHIPSNKLRASFLKEALRFVKPEGLLCVSLWRFAQEEKLLKKAQATTEMAVAKYKLGALEAGDFLVGWQNETDVYRYCHSFSDEDIDELVESLRGVAQLIANYDSDGRNGCMNRYLIFQRNETQLTE